MHRRARSTRGASCRRAEDLLDAARALAAERGGVRHVTLAAVTEAAGLHPSAVGATSRARRSCCSNWPNAAGTSGATSSPRSSPTRVGSGRARLPPRWPPPSPRYPCSATCSPTYRSASKVRSASTGPAATRRTPSPPTTPSSRRSATASTMTAEQVQDLIAATLGVTANLWQLAHPTATLAQLYAQDTPLGPRRARVRAAPHPPPSGHRRRPHRRRRLHRRRGPCWSRGLRR